MPQILVSQITRKFIIIARANSVEYHKNGKFQIPFTQRSLINVVFLYRIAFGSEKRISKSNRTFIISCINNQILQNHTILSLYKNDGYMWVSNRINLGACLFYDAIWSHETSAKTYVYLNMHNRFGKCSFLQNLHTQTQNCLVVPNRSLIGQCQINVTKQNDRKNSLEAMKSQNVLIRS